MLESLIINVEAIHPTKTIKYPLIEVLDKLLEIFFAPTEDGSQPATEAE